MKTTAHCFIAILLCLFASLLCNANDTLEYFFRPNCTIKLDKKKFSGYVTNNRNASYSSMYVALKEKKLKLSLNIYCSYNGDPTYSQDFNNPFVNSPANYRNNIYGDIYYDGKNYNANNYREENYEIMREKLIVNGFEFTIIKYLQESCGKEGTVSQFAMYAYVDTVLNNSTRIRAHSHIFWCNNQEYLSKRANLNSLLECMQEFRLLKPNELHAIKESSYLINYENLDKQINDGLIKQAITYRRRAIRYASNKKNKNYLEDYNNYWTDLMPKEEYKKLCDDKNYNLLGDTVARNFLHFQLHHKDIFIRNYKNFPYDILLEDSLYTSLNNGSIPVSDFLNHLNYHDTKTALDSIVHFIALEKFNFGALYSYPSVKYSPNIPDTFYYANYLNERYYLDFHDHFIKTFYKKHLHCLKKNFYPYVQLLDDRKSQQYFLFNPEEGKSSQILLTTFHRQDNGFWKHDVDTLDEKIIFKGNDKLTTFNNYFLLQQRDSTYIIDTTYSPAKCIALKQYPDTLKSYLFHCKDVDFADTTAYILPLGAQFKRELLPDSAINELWKTLVLNGKDEIKSESKPLYGYIDLNHGDTLIEPMVYYTYAKAMMPANSIAYNVDYTVSDLDNNGISELFTYCISNGNVINLKCYTQHENKLAEVPTTEALQLLTNDQNFQNLLIYSKIGAAMGENSLKP